jgi:dsRNA-specific ribonuclease
MSSNKYLERKKRIEILKSKGELDEVKKLEDTNTWSDNLLKFLETLFTEKLNIEINIFEEDCRDVWETAFTHKTYDRNHNYESYEFIGDRMLKSLFPLSIIEMVTATNPGIKIKESILTRAESYYMNNIYLSTLTDKLKLYDYVRLEFKDNFSDPKFIKGDLFETLFGAVSFICIMRGKTIISYQVLKDMFENIFSYCKIEIDLEQFNDENPVTAVTQIFKGLSNNDTDFDFTIDEGSNKIKTAKIVLSDNILSIIKQEIKTSIKPVFEISSRDGESLSMEKFKKNFYKQYFEYLISKGITKEFTEGYKFKKNIDSLESKFKDQDLDFDITNLYNKILLQNKKFKFKKIVIWTDKKINDNKYDREQLIGYYDSGEEKIINSFVCEKSKKEKPIMEIKSIIEYLKL